MAKEKEKKKPLTDAEKKERNKARNEQRKKRPKDGSIGGTAWACLDKGMTFAEAEKVVKKKHPKSKFNKAAWAYYKNWWQAGTGKKYSKK